MNRTRRNGEDGDSWKCLSTIKNAGKGVTAKGTVCSQTVSRQKGHLVKAWRAVLPSLGWGGGPQSHFVSTPSLSTTLGVTPELEAPAQHRPLPAPGWWGLESQAPGWGPGWAKLQGPFILTWRFLGDKGWSAGALGCPSRVGRGLWGAGLLQRVKSGPLPG